MKKELRKILLASKPEVIITKTFMEKVRTLCSYIHKIEWSGILFYDIKGDISNPSKMKITPVDILLMDEGSETFTSYGFDKDLIRFFKENPTLRSCKLGQIHSHHNMNVFFSGTDMDEINENAENHNFYFSLIVNNREEMVSKISFIGTTQPTSIKIDCKNKNGDIYNISKTLGSEDVIFYYDCDINNKYKKENILLGTIGARIAELRKKKEAERLANLPKYTPAHYTKYPNTNIPATTPGHKPLGVVTQNKYQKEEDLQQQLLNDIPEIEFDDATDDLVIEQFLCFLLREGNEVKDDSLDILIKELNTKLHKDENTFLNNLFINYNLYFCNFFDELHISNNPQLVNNITNDIIDYINVNYEEVDSSLLYKLSNLLNIYLTEYNKITLDNL